MILTTDKKKYISELAEFIYFENIEDGVIDLIKIAESEDISYSFGNYFDYFDGLIQVKNNKFHIFCNESNGNTSDSGRGRFTFAHELGHYFIDEHRNVIKATGLMHGSNSNLATQEPVEIEANYFAASLLMPEQVLKQRIKREKKSIKLFPIIGAMFNTSILSAAIRYVQLDIEPCGIVMWNESGENWYSISKSLINYGFTSMIRKDEKLYPGSATLAVKGKEPLETSSEITTAQMWFPFCSDFKNRELIFTEEAMSFGKYGVLSFLSLKN